MSQSVNARYGWIRQNPDQRDYTFSLRMVTLPESADTRPNDVADSIYQQMTLGSCTAQSIAGLYRYENHKQGLPDLHPCRLQIYYDERALEGTIESDAGAVLRDGLKVVATNGVGPEELWPYDITKFKQPPPQAVYDAAQQHQALEYRQVDQDLVSLKSCIVAGYQFVFGFTVYESFESDIVVKTGQMPLPAATESVLGGHAIRCVAFDNNKFGGSFIIANSWGTAWGDAGFFYMPYAYITNPNLASDFWTIVKAEG